VSGNRIFVTSGYGTGCALFEVTASGVSERWRNKSLRAHVSSPVIWQGAIYGIDNTASPKAPLVCLDLETGAVKWSEKLGGGALVVADGKLVILSEPGELIIGEASAAGFKPTLRQHVLPSRCWVQPTVANGKILSAGTIPERWWRCPCEGSFLTRTPPHLATAGHPSTRKRRAIPEA
jgi:outer membrane protein assembly factor BamB